MIDEHLLEIHEQAFPVVLKGFAIDDDFVPNRANQFVAAFPAAIFEQDNAVDRLTVDTSGKNLSVCRYLCGYRQRKVTDTAIEEEFFIPAICLQRRGVRVPGGVVVTGIGSCRKFRSGLW